MLIALASPARCLRGWENTTGLCNHEQEHTVDQTLQVCVIASRTERTVEDLLPQSLVLLLGQKSIAEHGAGLGQMLRKMGTLAMNRRHALSSLLVPEV